LELAANKKVVSAAPKRDLAKSRQFAERESR
jgi:hypothetical protein